MLSQLQQRGTHSTGLLISLPAQPDRPILPWPHSSISQLGEKPGFSIALYQKKTFDPEHKQDRYYQRRASVFMSFLKERQENDPFYRENHFPRTPRFLLGLLHTILKVQFLSQKHDLHDNLANLTSINLT